MSAPRLDAARLTPLLKACLANEGDAGAFKFAGIPEDRAAAARGENLPAYYYWLNQAEAEAHRDEIVAMLQELPEQFMDNGGGGWSFLNLCTDKNGRLWTGLQSNCEELIALAASLGLADWLMPREVWSAFPGAVPYVVVRRSKFAGDTP